MEIRGDRISLEWLSRLASLPWSIAESRDDWRRMDLITDELAGVVSVFALIRIHFCWTDNYLWYRVWLNEKLQKHVQQSVLLNDEPICINWKKRTGMWGSVSSWETSADSSNQFEKTKFPYFYASMFIKVICLQSYLHLPSWFGGHKRINRSRGTIWHLNSLYCCVIRGVGSGFM